MFFLYLIASCFSAPAVAVQTPSQELNQDSLTYYLKVVEDGEKQVAIALAKIGHLYQDAGRYNSAISYYEEALPLLNGEGKSLQAAEIHQSKGLIYEVFGDNAQPKTYYLLARNSFLRAAEIYENLGNATQIMMINQQLANIATKRRNFNRAVTYQNKVIQTLTRLYQDSLQTQAESFSDLLNKEIESSKDTIYIKDESNAEASNIGDRSVPLTNWRHWLILLLMIALLITVAGWIGARNDPDRGSGSGGTFQEDSRTTLTGERRITRAE